MQKPPVLETQRLWLRPLEATDTQAIQQAAATRSIADTMISLPHPYPENEAARYVAHEKAERSLGRSVTYTLKNKADGGFLGLLELRKIDREHLLAELSFWMVSNACGQGFMTEALSRVVRYGFEDLGLNRLYAYHMLRNPASGRVLEKNGFRQEGLLRERVKKWGTFEDVALWAILKHEWETDKSNAETGI